MIAYVDTSIIVAITLGETGTDELADTLSTLKLVAAPLLEAEWRSACCRERRALDPKMLDPIEWVIPAHPLSAEIARVLDVGYLRGADCWHLATALFLEPEPGELTFLTLDLRQREIASALGFTT